MKYSPKGSISILIVVISVVALAAAGAVMLYQAKQEEKSAISSFDECVAAGNAVMESYPRQCAADGRTFVEDIPEIQWEIYQQNAYHYQISYPRGWIVTEAGLPAADPPFGVVAFADTLVDDELQKVRFVEDELDVWSELYVIVHSNPDKLSLDAWYEKLTTTPGEEGRTLNELNRGERQVTVAGVGAIEFTMFAYDSLTARVFFPYDGNIFEIRFPSEAPSDPKEAEHQESFAYMLSSFSLVNPAASLNSNSVTNTNAATSELTQLGTYTNSTLSFSFTYPVGISIKESGTSVLVAAGEVEEYATGSDNAFMRISTNKGYFVEDNNRLSNTTQSTVTVDGIAAQVVEGDDYDRYEGDTAGTVRNYLFPDFMIHVEERPGNTSPTIDVLKTVDEIVATFQFLESESE